MFLATTTMTTQEQTLELIQAAKQTLESATKQAQWQLLGNADQLQSEIAGGKSSKEDRALLTENLIKRPLRRHIGLLVSLERTLQEISKKLSS